MVQVDLNQAMAPATEVVGSLGKFLGFLKNHWVTILLIIIVIILGALAFVFITQLKKEREERDSEAYAVYNTIMSDCALNKNKKWIKKHYSLMNLLWLGLPFKWNEHSAKLRDLDGNLIGYYRGHFDSQDGCRNYLIYKNAFLGIFEKKFILRFPKTIKAEKKDGTFNTVNLEKLAENRGYNDDIWFQATGIQKISIYYYTPNFVYDVEKREVVDLREVVTNSIMDNTWKTAYERTINQSTKMMRKAVEGNPFVQSKKQVTDVEQESKEIEEEERYSR